MNNILIKTANAAILGTTAKKAVIDVGAPSYTSGVHIWKGAIEILNAIADKIIIMAKTNKGWFNDMFEKLVAKVVNDVVPVIPKIKDTPNNKNPDAIAPKMKYFNPASEEFLESFFIAAKT